MNSIITISRQYGSGGRFIARKLAEKLGIPYYDNELITMAAKESGYSEAIFEKAEQISTHSFLYSLSMFGSAEGLYGLPLADKVYLATDPDREGEAISWHLQNALKLDNKKIHRITFNEITKNAVKESIKNSREINTNLVDAQQARRVLDRMVGYKISPVLWAKVKRGLSAGRVQSVALRMICDREEEINAFIPEEYWTLDAQLVAEGIKKPFTAKFYGTKKEQAVSAYAVTNNLNEEKIFKYLVEKMGYNIQE